MDSPYKFLIKSTFYLVAHYNKKIVNGYEIKNWEQGLDLLCSFFCLILFVFNSGKNFWKVLQYGESHNMKKVMGFLYFRDFSGISITGFDYI